MQSTPAVCAMPSIIRTPGNTGFSGKVSHEMRLVDRYVLDADAMIVAANVDDAVDHEKRIAVRQHFEHHRDIGRFKLGDRFIHNSRLSLSLPTCWRRIDARSLARIVISRNHSVTGLAGVPPQRAPGGTLP